jgi:multidrug efflux pump subunit AcrB
MIITQLRKRPTKRPNASCLVLFLLFTTSLFCLGCKPSLPCTVKIIVSGSFNNPQLIESEIVVPITQKITVIHELSSIYGVSSSGLAEIYVQSEPGTDAGVFRKKIVDRVDLAIPLLPKEAKIDKIEDVTGTSYPPSVTIKDIDNLKVIFDWEKMCKLGVIPNDAHEALNNAMNHENGKSDKMPDLAKIKVKSRKDTEVPLSDFAKATMTREPDHRIYRLP